MRRASLPAVVAVWGAAAATVALAAPARPPVVKPRKARLQGTFVVQGRVTSVSNVRGEHVGETVQRQWTFTPNCAAGVCQTIVLVRRRAHASDQVTLHHRGPGAYSGSSRFYAPLKCGSRVYHRGWVVPFTIKVTVTQASLSAGQVVASRIKATYTSRSRSNRTPCVMAPAHDSAKYRGHLM